MATSTARMVSESDYRWVPQQCPTCGVAPSNFVGYRGGSAHRQGRGVRCEIWSCGKCGLIFPNPMPVPVRGLAQHYGDNVDEYFDYATVEGKIAECMGFLRTAERLTGGVGRLLEIGPGRGELLKLAREHGWSAMGIEASDIFAAKAAEYSGVTVLAKPVEECDLPAESFDVVMMSAVMEHLYNPDAVLAVVSRCLRRGGVVYMEVPNERGFATRMGNLYCRLRRNRWCVNLSPTFAPFHVFGFSPRSLRALLRKHSLEPAVWHSFAGTNVLKRKPGLMGWAEHAGLSFSLLLSRGPLANYIRTWAKKV